MNRTGEFFCVHIFFLKYFGSTIALVNIQVDDQNFFGFLVFVNSFDWVLVVRGEEDIDHAVNCVVVVFEGGSGDVLFTVFLGLAEEAIEADISVSFGCCVVDLVFYY